ncbi:MAG: hypothetical protein LBG31_00650 [Prevotellaceae bacterium]|jgi:hypothetical protein|nr:hypothetical protein [Prevotellaceae bacterium]
MGNVKNIQNIPARKSDKKNNAAAAAQDAAGSTQTSQENPQQGGGNASKQEDTGVDKKKQKATTGAKGSVKKVSKWNDEAQKILKKYASEEVYFTSDGFCFLQRKEAEYHAATLSDKEITAINKKDVE